MFWAYTFSLHRSSQNALGWANIHPNTLGSGSKEHVFDGEAMLYFLSCSGVSVVKFSVF